MSEETTQAGVQAESSQPKPRSSAGRIIKIVIILAILAVAGYFAYSYFGGTVATVNGKRITMREYEKYLAQATAILAAQGIDTTTEENQALIKQRSIDDLVLEALVLQESEKEGIVANEDTIKTQIADSKKQFADDKTFEAELSKQGFTASSFEETLTRQNIIQQYLAKHVDVSSAAPTNAEVQAVYAQAAEANKDIPALSEIRTQVEAEVVRQKQQALVAEYLNKLKAASTIEISL